MMRPVTRRAWAGRFRIGAGLCLILGLALATGLQSTVSATSQQLVRYAYLTDLTTTSVTVNLATTMNPPHPVITWSLAGGTCTTNSVSTTITIIKVNGVTEYQARGTITGLSPNTAYCYRILQGSTDMLSPDPSPVFTTALPAGATSTYSFAVLGDWGDTTLAPTNPDEAAILALMAGSGARFVVTTGDNAYPGGSQTAFGDLIQTGTNMSAVFGPSYWRQLGASIPGHMTTGNHGFSTDGANTLFADWPQAALVAGSGGRNVIDTYCCVNGTNSARYPSQWYAFDFGTARFYVLESAWANGNVGTASMYQNDHDAHWTTSSDEYRWLAADLSAHPGVHKFAFSHFPVYSDNNTEKSDTFLQGPGELEELLAQGGVRVLFNGHAHMYERNTTAFPSMVQYVAGGGGAKLEPVNHCSAFDSYAIGWSYSSSKGSSCRAPKPTSPSQVFHYLLVTVSPTSVTVTPTDETGRSFDVQTFPLP